MIAAAVLLVASALTVWLLYRPFGGESRADRAARERESVDTVVTAPEEPAIADESEEATPATEAVAEESVMPEETEKPPAAAEPEESEVDSSTGDDAAEPTTAESAPDKPEAAEEPAEEAPAVGTTAQDTPRTGTVAVVTAGTYSVRTYDTLFDIAGDIWGDPYVWPLLLLANEDTVTDPDFLRPGQRITVPEWDGLPLSSEETSVLAAAHLLAYERYRVLGESSTAESDRRLGAIRINKSLWVLYSGLRYDHGLVDSIRGEIRVDDAEKIDGFIARYGYPPDP